MANYNDKKKVCRFDVGEYSTLYNCLWWTKDKTLLTFNLENVFKKEGHYPTNEFNKFEDIEIFFREPLDSQKVLFHNYENIRIGKARTEKDLKMLILNYKYNYDKKIKKK